MKARLKDQAFLIKSSPYSDSSLVLKAFGREHGLLSLLAKGVRSTPRASLLSPLYLYEFSYYESREAGLCLLAEFSLAEEFDFTDRIEVWTAAECALELYSQLIIPAEESAAYFDLLRDYLVYLRVLPRNAVLIWWRFLLRVFRMLGVPCDTCACSACGSGKLSVWEWGSGRLLCAGCRDSLTDPRSCEPLSSVAARVLGLLPVIGGHLDTLNLDRSSVASLNDLFAQYYQAHFHKALQLRGLKVLEQFYA